MADDACLYQSQTEAAPNNTEIESEMHCEEGGGMRVEMHCGGGGGYNYRDICRTNHALTTVADPMYFDAYILDPLIDKDQDPVLIFLKKN